MNELEKISDDEIAARIDECPRLASLRSINKALFSLINAESTFSSQIAEVIRRDPTLTTRILKLVNSVFFGLGKPVTSVEEAILYLGIRQIRELALATPVIEDLALLNKHHLVHWTNMWSHSIGTAILTREILTIANIICEDEGDYIIGLLHNVGKLVMAFAFPEYFTSIVKESFDASTDVCECERNTLGWDHEQIGAYYLKQHRIPEFVHEAIKFHHRPSEAGEFKKFSAAIQLADYLIQSIGFTGLEKVKPVNTSDCFKLDSWPLLFGADQIESTFVMASLNHSLERLPGLLSRLI